MHIHKYSVPVGELQPVPVRLLKYVLGFAARAEEFALLTPEESKSVLLWGHLCLTTSQGGVSALTLVWKGFWGPGGCFLLLHDVLGL